jgi:glycine cleavage system regulatory protein
MNFVMHDPRLLARIINLVHRFGCSYSSVRARAGERAFTASIDLHGPADALRRLRAQVHKLLDDDKEHSQ